MQRAREERGHPGAGLSARLAASILTGALAAAGCGSDQAPAPPQAPPAWKNLVLISVDTLRPDHTSAYGSSVPTQAMKRLAEEGVLFERAFSPVPMTQPAHSSLFTGNYPGRHGVRDNVSFTLSDRAETMAEGFQRAGFQTAAIVGAKVISRSTGLDQGFEHYDDEFTTEQLIADPMLVERSAGEVRKRAIEWIDARDSARPFFLFLHFYDPHVPYAPPGKLRKQYAKEPYDGEIAYTDVSIGAILGHLDQASLLEETAVILTADHGESLGEHGEQTHGLFVYDSALHIPLVLRLPGVGARRGLRIYDPVSLVDVMPTVFDLFRIPSPDMDGVSLVPYFTGRGLPPRDIFGETTYPLFYGWSPSYSIRSGRYKYIHSTVPELYQIDTDTSEARDMIEQRADLASQMRTALQLQMRRWEESANTAEEAETLRSLEAMAALGYTGGGGLDPETAGTLPDMKSRVATYEELSVAMSLMGEERWEEARERFEILLEKEPNNPSVLLNQGQVLMRLGRYGEAEASLRKCLEFIPDNRQARATLGMVLFAWQRLDEANAVFSDILEDSPKSPEPMFYLAQIHEMRGEHDEALALYERVQELLPGMPGVDDRVRAMRALAEDD